MNRENLLNNDEVNPAAARWDMSDAPQFNAGETRIEDEEESDARRRNKIIASFLHESNGDYSISILRGYDASLGEGDEDRFLDLINNGTIDSDAERAMLAAVPTEMDAKGFDKVLGGITDYHERKILALVSGGNPDDLASLSEDNLKKVRGFYPTAMEFEERLGALVEHIRSLNNDAKAAEYRAAGEALMAKAYGEQNSYWSQFKELNAAAAEKRKIEESGIFGDAVYESATEKAEAKKDPNAARQQRKMVGALLTCGNLDLSADVLKEHDVTLPEGARDDLLDMVNDGRVTRANERSVLRLINSDMELFGSEDVFGKLRGEPEQRIAAWISGVGFNSYPNLSPKSLESAFFDYPCAMDFEAVLPQLIDWIRANSGDQTAAVYQAAGESFMKKFYGKQAEYLEQINAINADAEARKTKKPVIESGSGNSVEAAARMKAEAERSYEWDAGTVAYCQTSRSQAVAGEIFRDKLDGELWADNSCQDSVLSRPEHLLFGVFDGAGGMGSGDVASRFVADTLSRLSDVYPVNNLDDLKSSIRQVLIEMDEKRVPGFTTAVVSKLVEKPDGIYLAYVSIGDSRLYIIHEDGTGEQITEDEGTGHEITNAMSASTGNIQQFGEYRLKRGDKIMMCSDGITGDTESDSMSVETVSRIVKNSRDSQDASRNLVANARKKDDRTALVIGAW